MEKYSHYDKIKNVKVPSISSPLLAYETGVHMSDGSLQIVDGGTHSTRYFGNSDDDFLFFCAILPYVIKQIYNKDVNIGMRTTGKTCNISVCSKKIALFKRDVLGLPVGNKINLQHIPKFIIENNKLAPFLCGFADGDMSLNFSKNYAGIPIYPEISCTLSNKGLLRDIVGSLESFGFHVSTKYNIQRVREGIEHTEHRFFLSGNDQIERWMHIIGFLNPKHITKYLLWKRDEYCESKTTTFERIFMLNNKIPQSSFKDFYQLKAKTP